MTKVGKNTAGGLKGVKGKLIFSLKVCEYSTSATQVNQNNFAQQFARHPILKIV